MKFKVLMLLTEAPSKLSGEIEAAYEKFERDFKKETGKSVNQADIKTIKNSRAFKTMTKSLKDDTDYEETYDDYNYYDHYDSYAKYGY